MRPSYEAELRDRITAVRRVSKSFARMCEVCDGASPSEVFRLASEAGLVRSQSRRVNGLKTQARPDLCGPEPHPADFDWRFSVATSEFLADLAIQRGHDILCLGTPSVYAILKAKTAARAMLWDQNPLWLNCRGFNALELKLTPIRSEKVSVADRHSFDVVVMDPPWYLRYYRSWLSIAAASVRPRGSILMPVFGSLLRPRAEKEVKTLLAAAEQVGTVRRVATRLVYDTPPFEREVFRESGVPMLHCWRTAALASITATVRIDLTAPNALERYSWDRFVVSDQVVLLRRDTPESSCIVLRPPFDGGRYVPPSTSARDASRHRINLWTSRNRAFSVSGRSRISQLLQRLQKGHTWESVACDLRLTDSECSALEPFETSLALRN